MTNKYELAKLHENAIRHKKANWQEQIRGKRHLKRENFWLVLEWTKTKTLKWNTPLRRGEKEEE